MKRLVPIFSTAACLAVLVLFAEMPANAVPAQPNQLVILATSDVKGKTEPCGCHVPKGGLSRRAFFRDSVAKVRSQVSLVDNGGFAPLEDAREDEAWFVMETMAKLGMDAVGTGPGDLRFGYAKLKTNLARTRLPMTSANLIDVSTQASAFAPYVIAKVGAVKVGYFSLMNVTSDLGPDRSSLTLADPTVTAKKVVAELRKQGATVVVLLSQLDNVESEDLVTMVPGIDAVICGRNAPVLAKGRTFNTTIASYPGSEGHYLGVTTLTLGAGGKVTARESATIALGPDVGERSDILGQVKEFETALNARLAKVEKDKPASPEGAIARPQATSESGGHN